ncbi:MAG: xanthine dehydrogenase family protein subunit M [Deltaproteobacteria bacterium]|nr:xanthine dehydrogenase family protein subunit M [Deltaproteobacteria bacterium]
MFIRRLPKFDYHAPSTIAEALEQMAHYGEKAKVFAGGTDIFVSMKKRETMPQHMINLKGVGELRGIAYDGEQGLKIGALTTIGDIERSEIVRKDFRALWDAVKVIAAPQVRNLATIGGNLCSAVPSADTAPPLMVLGASLKLMGPKLERVVPIENFFTGPRESILKKEEILAEILIPSSPDGSGGAYVKLMRRNALDLALVGVGVFLRLEGNQNKIREARIALGAVAPTPKRAARAETLVAGREPDEKLILEAGKAASEEAVPISDIRASEGYRRDMVEVLTQRAMRVALQRIAGEDQ